MRYMLILVLLTLSCSSKKEAYKLQKPEPSVLTFLKSKSYRISFRKQDIPDFVVDSLGKINGGPFVPGDRFDEPNFNFADVHFNDSMYRVRLNLLLVNDTACLLVYTEGGIGKHDVVDYFNYDEEFKHWRYTAAEELKDTTKLREYLQTDIIDTFK